MDALQLQSTPCLSWTLLPEIQKFVSSYAEEFIREIAGQVMLRPYVLYCCLLLLN